MQRKKVVFEPLDKEHIRIYACGPTVYDYAHIGNARMAVVFDSLVRLLRSVYTNVTYVSNITDIDDKIIDRSIKDKVGIKEVYNKFAKIYNKDMHMLNVLAPDFQPKATDYVEKMIKDIKVLIDKNYAYYSDKHVVFDVDVVGGISLKEYFKENSISIFIKPPIMEVLSERLKKRNSDYRKAIKNRLEKSFEEMKSIDKFDKIIINDELNISTKYIVEIVEKFLK